MSFLTRIDELHFEQRKKYNIDKFNNDFSSFLCVEPIDITFNTKFVIKKQEKAKLLLLSGNQRVYLSDDQIISTILNMEKQYIDWFLDSFIKLYMNQYTKFKFKIKNETFEGIGLCYYPNKYDILLFSDTTIDINEFIFLLNFVFSKDRQWEYDKPIEGYSKRTIVKYIALIDYYANKENRSRDFLSSIGYPISESKFSFIKNEKKLFSDLSTFDISKYV